ncbi:MAG: 2,3-bisphosphoglycerate-independent phosphoglycerate mutase [Fidelibacterota bacterium]
MKGRALKFILIIVDGLGLRDSSEANAFKLARTPVLDTLLARHPWSRLEASGPAVGLPDGVIGNSEVGHMTIGAGRIVKHDLVRIHEAIASGELEKNPVLKDAFARSRKNRGALHLMGLVSDGGVHSHIDHLLALLRLAKWDGITRVYVHAITDGRDTSPRSGIQYVHRVLKHMEELGAGTIATVMGRYYAMDRDRRWDRTKTAYRAMMGEPDETCPDPVEGIRASYEKGVTDEFIRPIGIHAGDGVPALTERDVLFCFNFRADRMRQITRAIGEETFHEFPRTMGPVFTVTMTSYDDTFTFPVVFTPISLTHLLGEVLASAGYRQLRVAETEKYAHVTYFFNGGDETPFPHEERILVPSPRVPTYDRMPEMSAKGIQETVMKAMEEGTYDCIIMNLANPDMVGHTGNLKAAIRAVEVTDGVLGEVIAAARERGAAVFVTADHGNAEVMTSEDGSEEHTAHTVNPVPFVMVNPSGNGVSLEQEGGLADIAPTILDYLKIAVPPEMSGRSLLRRS